MTRNVEAFERVGIFVPETGTRGYKIPHHALAFEYQGRDKGHPTDLFSKLREELVQRGRPKRIMLSSEEFEFGISHAARRRSLVSYFSDLGYRLKVIAYVRPQDGYVNSSYAQMTKFLTDLGPFPDYMSRALRQARFDYSQHLLPLFRDPDLTSVIRPFNGNMLVGSIESDFLSLLGLSTEEAAKIRRIGPVNETPGPKTIAACRNVMARLAQERIEIPKRRVRLWRFIRELTDSMGWNDVKFNALTPDISAAINEYFSESNENFSQEVWSRSWAEVFEAKRELVSNVYDPSLDSQEAKHQFSRVTNRITERIREAAEPVVPQRFWMPGKLTGKRRKF